MLRIFQIISFVLLALSIAASVLIVLVNKPAGEEVDQFIDAPLTAETYKGKLDSLTDDEDSKSPLLAQAEALSLRLNPPPPKTDSNQSDNRQRSSSPKPPSDPKPQKPVTAKFDLLGTCVNMDAQNLSTAYINIPGEGRKWVYQGDKVGRLKITEVKKNSVVYTDGGELNELEMVDQPSSIKSLLKSDQPEVAQAEQNDIENPDGADKRTAAARRLNTQPGAALNTSRRPPQPRLDPKQQQKQLKQSLEMMSQWKNDEQSEELKETMKNLEKLMSNPQQKADKEQKDQ